MLGESRGVADSADSCDHEGVVLRPDDTDYLDLLAVVDELLGVFLIAVHIVICAGLGIVAVKIRLKDYLEGLADYIRILYLVALACVFAAAHHRHIGIHHFLGGHDAEALYRKVADLVILIDDKHDLVVFLGESALNNVILRGEQLFVIDKLLP